MSNELQREIIHLSGVLVIPNSMPECLRIQEIASRPVLNRYLIKDSGIVFQGLAENVLSYIYACPTHKIEKIKTLKSKVNFARFIENENLNAYAQINLKAELAWQEFSLIDSRHIRFSQIIHVNLVYTQKNIN